jgi:hypothetical protein
MKMFELDKEVTRDIVCFGAKVQFSLIIYLKLLERGTMEYDDISLNFMFFI